MVDATSPDDITQNVNSGNTDTNSNQNNPQSGSGCIYDKWGRTPDKSQICAIGTKSASADTQSGVVKCVFENKCAHCGKPALMWGWQWSNDPEKVQKFDGTDGVAEGHIYCVQSEGGCDADFSIEGNEHINGSTAKLTMVSGPTPSSEEEGQKLSSGQLACDGSTVSGGASSGGGSGVLIPDKTFFGLIKQMMGAVDAMFIVANNMAYLLSFKDIYEYRDLYDEYIPEIETNQVLRDSVVKNYSTDGYYNAVEVSYADGIIKYQNDVLVKQYGENVWYYDFPDDDEETAKAKADALLSAHIRDYSTDIELSVFYNPRITEGSWVKVNKTLTQISGKTRKEIEQDAIKKEGKTISTQHMGVNITNMTEKIVTDEEGIKKTIQSITDEEGDTFDIEIEKSDYELFFVHGYTVRWDKDNSLIMDLHLKYGPDTPEDPINATIGTMGGGGQSASVGGQPADITAFVKKCLGNSAKQDMATVQKLYDCLCSLIIYSYYDCSDYQTASECYQFAGGGGKHPEGINCADTSRLVVACYKAAGFDCQVVSCDGHYWNEVMVNGQAQTVDCSSGTTGQHCTHPLGHRLLAGVPKSNSHGDNPSC